MKVISFYDADNQKISISLSSAACFQGYRVYLYPRGYKKEDDPEGKKLNCLHMTREQVCILINGLQDLMNDCDEE